MSDKWLKNIIGLSDGTIIKAPEKDYETPKGGGDFKPFPDGTSLKAAIDEAKWAKDNAGLESLKLRWSILLPEEYANRKVFQTLWIKDLEPNEKARSEEKAIAKRDRQRMMFAAIDANAGGKIVGLINDDVEIKDEHLMTHLTNMAMVIRIDLFEPRDGGAPRNYVAKISQKSEPISSAAEIATGMEKLSPVAKSSSAAKGGRILDDEIPF
jgi:hypothetical protein